MPDLEPGPDNRWGVLLLALASTLALGIGCVAMRPPEPTIEERFGPGAPLPRVEVRRVAELDVRWVEVGRSEGPVLLFVHGSPGGWNAYLNWLRDGDLAARALMLSLDRPGYGGSNRGIAMPSLEDQASVLADRLNAVGPRPVLAVGHSLGGSIVARLAADRPDLVHTLLLIAPSVSPELEELRWYNRAATWRLVRALLPTDLGTSNLEMLPLRSELEDLAERWDRIQADVVVMQGEKDRLVPAGNADWIEARIASEKRRILRYPDQGHFLLWREPQLVKAELTRWLDAVETPDIQFLENATPPT